MESGSEPESECAVVRAILHFWRGRHSLARTFWLGWAIPVIGGTVLLSRSTWWLIDGFGLTAFYMALALLAIYTIVAVVPVWRSATAYAGNRLFKYGARAVAAIAMAIQVVAIGTTAFYVVGAQYGLSPTHDPERIAEKSAIPSETHPLAGFWKSSPTDNFGLAIAPAEGNLYSVSFCGPGGCFKPGTYRSDTPLVGDEDYQVISTDTLLVRSQDGWSTYSRAPNRGSDECPKPQS